MRVYICFFALVVLVQLLGGWATSSSVSTWYPELTKPPHNPTAWVFGPVWTALYLMIAVAGARVWRALQLMEMAHPANHAAMRWYGIQLLLNLAWSVVFFGMQSPLGGVVVIVLLAYAIARTLYLFKPLDKVAYWLLVPYWLWVLFAATLNAGILWLN